MIGMGKWKAAGPRSGEASARKSSFGVVPLAIITALVVLLTAGYVFRQAGTIVNDLVAAREAKTLEQGLARRLVSLHEDVAYVGVWDEAYRKAALSFDPIWTHENFGAYFAGHMRHSLTLIVGGDGRVVYASQGGRVTSPASLADFVRAARPLIETVGARTAARPADQASALGLARHRHQEAVVKTATGVYLVSAGSLAPENSWKGPLVSGREPVVVSAKRLDAAYLADLGKDYDLDGLRLIPVDGKAPARILLRGPGGTPVAGLGWEPFHLRTTVLAKAGGPFAAVGLCLLLLVTLLVLRIRAVDRDLKAAAVAARAADQAKSVFLANMSHEIRTPLNAVLGMAQVMEGDTLSARQRERLGLIRDAGQTLLGVLNDVLDLSRIEAGQLTISLAPFELEALAKGALLGFEGQAAAKGVSVTLEFPEAASGWWRGDAQRIRQIVSNLVSNAVKFTEAGSVRLVLERTEDGVRFSVHDTGPGIEPEVLAGLFARFAQADDSITRRHGGTGLGLSISRELAELMGGTLSATSTPGEGSCFTLDLPMSRVAAAVRAEPAAPAALERRVRVLAAEDNPANRRVLAALLEPLDIELELVRDGREMVEAWRMRRPDVILADIQMPMMSGLEATALIRADEAGQGGPRVPIIALTANVMSDQVAAYRAAGMDAHVAKPIQATDLFEALAAAVTSEPEAERGAA
ncbi:response regulator [Caulobacter sp. SLTY]|uniref:ATP-binding protein n=1 Tax=Caulobacter sp. SLTY TaxID=2683262 RepID=UPI001411D2CC|nr:ATP-binding protein [Caulobacter sp. SLTY]NBB17332.1 response regulator [Caulobacter sp. SLTY]